MNERLLMKLKETDTEKELLQRIVEQQEIQNTLNAKEITRLSKKAGELQKRVVKEKVKRESLLTQMNYSNPAKLMNYMRVQKAKGNSSYRSNAEYVSHVDAYARCTSETGAAKSSRDLNSSTESKRQKYAKLLAHKRQNDPNMKHHGAPRPPKRSTNVINHNATQSRLLMDSRDAHTNQFRGQSDHQPPRKKQHNAYSSFVAAAAAAPTKDTYYACRTNSSLNSRLEDMENYEKQLTRNETQPRIATSVNMINMDLSGDGDVDESVALAANDYLNAELKCSKTMRQPLNNNSNRKAPITSLSGVSTARYKLSSALNETNRLMHACHSSRATDNQAIPKQNTVATTSTKAPKGAVRPQSSTPLEQKTMRELLSEQRKALRDFSSYYRMRGANN